MLKIYNSLTRQKEIFQPIDSSRVKIYVCGVTVYDYCHLGHARTYVAFDVIIRYLKQCGYTVTQVRNITDIDDKIIKRALESQTMYRAVVDRFTQAMHEDFKALAILSPDEEPCATDYIPHMITAIETLIARGYAYVAPNGDVYYEVRRFKAYGQLAHRDIDQLESGARVEIAEVKRDPLDFVLWKQAKPGEPSWESPWGSGRPGWHLECSVMSTCLLGESFDIHGGGKDLIFPHHENEIAQAEGTTGCSFVKTWMHAGYLQIDQEKMSKSLGNFFTIREVLKTHRAEVIRYFLINSHYRSPVAYSEEGLQQAHHALQRLYTALCDLSEANVPQETTFERKFKEAMDDDFNTVIAVSVLFEIAHAIQRARNDKQEEAASLGALLKKLGSILGILQQDPLVFLQTGGSQVSLDVEEIERLIAARNEARLHQNWAEADRLRDLLGRMSIVLDDSADGTRWRFIQ